MKRVLHRFRHAVRLLIGAALLLPALGLIAFGPRTSRDVPPNRVVVTYWEKWTDFEGEAMKRLVNLFNDTAGAEQGIFIDYVVTTQIDLKSLVAISGGDPPDLAGLWPQNISSFAAKGALQSLDARAARAGLTRDRLVPIYYDGCCYHDHLWGLPSTPWSIVLYYNKDILRQNAAGLAAAGYDASRPPRTLDELLGYCKVLCQRRPNGDITRMGFLPALPETVGWYWDTWGLWANGTFDDPKTGRAKLDSPEFIRGYQWVRDFVETFGQREVLRFESSLANINSPDNPFMKGKLVMMQQGPWFANMIRQYAPEIDYGVAPHPTGDGSELSFCGGDIMVIPNGARHPDQAWAFVEWLYNSPPVVVPSADTPAECSANPQFGYEYYVAKTLSGPERRPMEPMRPIEWLCWNHYKNGPLAEPSPAFIATHPNPGVAVHERVARSTGARGYPPLPDWFALLDQFGTAYRDVWGAPNVDVRARLTECQRRIDELVQLSIAEQRSYGDRYP